MFVYIFRGRATDTEFDFLGSILTNFVARKDVTLAYLKRLPAEKKIRTGSKWLLAAILDSENSELVTKFLKRVCTLFYFYGPQELKSNVSCSASKKYVRTYRAGPD